jgi:uncharacterized membrane protein
MVLDPVEYVIIEFPGNRFTGEIAPALADLVDEGVVRILDLVFVQKDADGSITFFEYDELEELEAFGDIEGEADGLMSDEDIVELAADLAPDSSALFIVWEDKWAAPLGRAIRNAGGRLLAGERIPHEVVSAALTSIDQDTAQSDAPQSDTARINTEMETSS